MKGVLVANPTPALQRLMVFDRVTPNEVNRASSVELLPSGKGLNCARAAARLGADVQTVLFLGGVAGEWVRQAAESEGLRIRSVPSSSSTRTCCTLIETETGTVTELVENAGPMDAPSVDAFVAAFRDGLTESAVAVLIGALPAGADANFHARLVREASARGVPCIVDTQGPALLAAVAQRPFLVKPNRPELAAATGCSCAAEAELESAVRRLHELGACNVLVTDGPRPALLSNGTTTCRIEPPAVAAVNPIGSGDTLAGALAFRLARGAPLTEGVRYAVACACADAAAGGYGRLDPAVAETLSRSMRPLSGA